MKSGTPEDFKSSDYESFIPIFSVECWKTQPTGQWTSCARWSRGQIGKLHLPSSSGEATVSRRCAEMGNEMAAELKSRRIDAVIFTST
jgi:hypothetical protein